MKPENVLVAHADPTVVDDRASDTDEPLIKITDFGIAKLLDAQGVTSTGQVLGSPAHMAPEQIEGGDVTARADVFGLGVLLYECMVGHLPFDGKNPAQVLRRVLDGAFTPADRRGRPSGRPTRLVLDRALAHDSNDRFASAAELADALRGELERSVSNRRGASSTRSWPTRLLIGGARVARSSRVSWSARRRRKSSATSRSPRLVTIARSHTGRMMPELLSSVSTLARGERLRQSARRFGVVLIGALGLGGAALVVARAIERAPGPPAPPPSAKLPAPKRLSETEAVTPSPVVSASNAAKAAPARSCARDRLAAGRAARGAFRSRSGPHPDRRTAERRGKDRRRAHALVRRIQELRPAIICSSSSRLTSSVARPGRRSGFAWSPPRGWTTSRWCAVGSISGPPSCSSGA